MSSFSDLLSYHIHNSGKSKIQIAEAIGMPRTNFQKISTGARKPQDEHTLEKIMNELFLSVKEKKSYGKHFIKIRPDFSFMKNTWSASVFLKHWQ